MADNPPADPTPDASGSTTGTGATAAPAAVAIHSVVFAFDGNQEWEDYVECLDIITNDITDPAKQQAILLN